MWIQAHVNTSHALTGSLFPDMTSCPWLKDTPTLCWPDSVLVHLVFLHQTLLWPCRLVVPCIHWAALVPKCANLSVALGVFKNSSLARILGWMPCLSQRSPLVASPGGINGRYRANEHPSCHQLLDLPLDALSHTTSQVDKKSWYEASTYCQVNSLMIMVMIYKQFLSLSNTKAP